MSRIRELYELVTKLRSPEGCPWDREQTNETLKNTLIEESYEVLEAIESGDPEKLKEELGDVLFLVLMHVRIAEEMGYFTLDEVVEFTKKKMVERHPHVFGEREFKDRDELLTNWEKSKKKGTFDGLTFSLPALMLAQLVSERARRLGFDWPDPRGVLDKIEEEIGEFREALKCGNITKKSKIEEELGDILFALANLSRHMGVEAEEALKYTVRKFVERFKLMESYARKGKMRFEDLSLEEMEELWQRAKKELNKE